jgi:hypothetical protein
MGRQAAAIGERLHSALADACKALALEIVRELKRRGVGTPVDTGHARANWIPSVGSPSTTEAPGNSTAAQDQGVAQVLSFKLGDGVLWVSNVVSYVPMLNRGSSKQAPALFIEAAVDRALTTVQQRFAKRIDISELASGIRSQLGASGAENLASAYSPFGDD